MYRQEDSTKDLLITRLHNFPLLVVGCGREWCRCWRICERTGDARCLARLAFPSNPLSRSPPHIPHRHSIRSVNDNAILINPLAHSAPCFYTLCYRHQILLDVTSVSCPWIVRLTGITSCFLFIGIIGPGVNAAPVFTSARVTRTIGPNGHPRVTVLTGCSALGVRGCSRAAI